jgi:hypothetical protein
VRKPAAGGNAMMLSWPAPANATTRAW